MVEQPQPECGRADQGEVPERTVCLDQAQQRERAVQHADVAVGRDDDRLSLLDAQGSQHEPLVARTLQLVRDRRGKGGDEPRCRGRARDEGAVSPDVISAWDIRAQETPEAVLQLVMDGAQGG